MHSARSSNSKIKKTTKQIEFLFHLLPAGGLPQSTAQRKDFFLP